MAWVVSYTRSGPNQTPVKWYFKNTRYLAAWAVYGLWSAHYTFSHKPFKSLVLYRREGNRVGMPKRARGRNVAGLRAQSADFARGRGRSIFTVGSVD